MFKLKRLLDTRVVRNLKVGSLVSWRLETLRESSKVLIEVGKLPLTEKRSKASNFQTSCIPSSFRIVGKIPISHFQYKTLQLLSFSNYTFQLYINHYLVRMQSYLIANE